MVSIAVMAACLHETTVLVVITVGGVDVRYSLAVGEDIRALLEFRSSSA